ncbi:MAG: F0F1 ATP synthase subunit gamma [Schwartzia sp.]|nr:F0F1 ATP synthase subunit gamma [Schwartzia sp. (in: firmicutes)]
MASLQDIRRRIKSVKSIQQITKAMKMVAAARLRRAQRAAVANRPYANKMEEILESVAAHVGDFQHPLLETYPDGKELYVVLAADKGLAGAYSSNVFKEAVSHIPDRDAVDLITIGRRTEEHFRNRNYHIVNYYMGISEKPTFEDARKIAADITERYMTGEYSSIYLVYTRFVSAISSVPETFKLLPFEDVFGDADEKEAEETFFQRLRQGIEAIKSIHIENMAESKAVREKREKALDELNFDEYDNLKNENIILKDIRDIKDLIKLARAEKEEAKVEEDPFGPLEPLEPLGPLPEPEYTSDIEESEAADKDAYIFEPSADEVLNYILPQYLVTMIYAAQLQAAASELSSRMTAMSTATDNAEELNKKLDLQYNKVRQAHITTEMSEIVGGAEALK